MMQRVIELSSHRLPIATMHLSRTCHPNGGEMGIFCDNRIMKTTTLIALVFLAAVTVSAQEYKPPASQPITFYVNEAPTTGSIPNARYVTPQATYETNTYGTPTSVEVNPIYQYNYKVQIQPTQQGLPTYQVPQFQSPNSTYKSGVPQTTWQSNNSGVVTQVETQGVAQWQYQPVVVPTTGTTQTGTPMVLPGVLQKNP